MASINGWVFIIIGTGMWAVVFFFAKDLWVFNYIAALFAAYGVIKVGANSIMNMFVKKKAKNHAYSRHHSQQGYSQHHPQSSNQQHPSHHQQHTNLKNNPNQTHNSSFQQARHGIFCSRCGSSVGLTDNYCPKCGNRLR